MKTNKWTPEEVQKLHKIVTSNGGPGIASFKKASGILKRSTASCERRFSRGGISQAKHEAWTKEDILKLRYLRAVCGYDYLRIANELGHSAVACERQYQRKDWTGIPDSPALLTKLIQSAHEEIVVIEEQKQEVSEEELDNQRIVAWLISAIKWDYERLQELTEEGFQAKLKRVFSVKGEKIHPETLHLPFEEYKDRALTSLKNMGFAYPLRRELGPGLYLIVGESHGKRMSTNMFKMLKVIDKELNPTCIIHQGHISDDDDQISYNWHEMFGRKLIVLGVKSELMLLKDQEEEYDVIRHHVQLGRRVKVMNQYDVGDFAKKSVGKIDMRTLQAEAAIVGLHRHEVYTHCSHPERKIIASAGSMCEKHIIMTEKMYISKEGEKIIRLRKVMPQGFKKYNKQEQDAERWEQGLLVVEIDAKGDATITPCRIYQTSQGCTTSFFNKVFTSNGVREPEKKVFFNGDLHCSYHDPAVLDLQEQFCMDYRPDIHVNVGDMVDNRSLNHHMGGMDGAAYYFDADGNPVYSKLIQEIATIRWILKRMRTWAPKSYLILGNHERFMMDFVRKHPQLHGFMALDNVLDSKRLDISVTPLKGVLNLYGMKFIHGEQKFFGGTGGSKVDKATNCYGENTIMGHLHYTCVRAGGYMVGTSGKMNQDYNEPQASQWIHGFGYANVFEGQCFVTVVSIVNGGFMQAGKAYTPRNLSDWVVPKFSFRMDVAFETPEKPEEATKTPEKAVVGLKKAPRRPQKALRAAAPRRKPPEG